MYTKVINRSAVHYSLSRLREDNPNISIIYIARVGGA